MLLATAIYREKYNVKMFVWEQQVRQWETFQKKGKNPHSDQPIREKV